MPVGISVSDYVSSDTNAVMVDVLYDGDMFRLVGSVEEVGAEDADDNVQDPEDPVPILGQVMGALDLLRQFAGIDEKSEDTLDARNQCGQSLRSARKQRPPFSLLKNRLVVFGALLVEVTTRFFFQMQYRCWSFLRAAI